MAIALYVPGRGRIKDRTGEFPNSRICCNCHRSLPISEFGKHQYMIDGLSAACKDCRREDNRRYRSTHLIEEAKNRKRSNGLIKKRTIEYYGGVCKCCSESRIEFLCIDHINGGGTKHRKQVGGGTAFYLWLKRNNYPSGFRVLCHNCNGAIAYCGYCPHNNQKEVNNCG